MLKKLLPFWLSCVALAVAAEPNAKPAKHAITHVDVWLMKRVGAPVPSPDGKWVVYAVTEPAYDAKDQWSDLWIKSLTDESPARRLTFSKGGEGGVAWSPDGTKLLFSAKRDGDEAGQFYLLNLSGGEAERITNLSAGVGAAKWSPDGKSLLFVSQVYPGASDEEANKKAAKERKDRKYNVRAYDQFPPRFWNHWLDDRKPHVFVQEARAAPRRAICSQAPSSRHFPVSVGRRAARLKHSKPNGRPDGTAVVFAAATNRQDAARAHVPVQIFVVDVAGGEPRQLTHGPDTYGRISFSPDGHWLLCTTDPNTPDKVYDLPRLARFPWPFKDERRVLTAGLDRAIGNYATPEGSDRIYFTFEHAGLEQLHSVSYAGGDVRDEPSLATGSITSLAAGGRALVGTWDSAISPPEVYSFTGTPKRLTSINTGRAATIDWLPVEHFWFKASDGRDLHSMLVKPPGFDPAKKYPLFVVIHGGAANMWHDTFVLRWNYHLLAQPGYVVLLTDYKGSTGYGEEFARAIQFDPLKGPAIEINEAADEAIRRYALLTPSVRLPVAPVTAVTSPTGSRPPPRATRRSSPHAGEMDLIMQWGTSDGILHREINSGSPVWGDSTVWQEQSPVMQGGNHAKGTGFLTPILITVGEQDYRVPLNNALMNFATQQRLGVPSRLLVFPEAGHHVLRGEDSRYWYGEIHAWLKKWL